MFSYFSLLVFSTLVIDAGADVIPRIPPHTNTSSLGILVKTSSGASTSRTPAPVCCFAVQDVLREEWWDITTTSSIWKVVNFSKLTAHISSWPGTIPHTSYETNVQTTNASFPVTAQIGNNPISLFNNGAPKPSEVAHSNQGSALITGGVTVQSPAAFYIYSTVKIITAGAVRDGNGNWACGTASGGFANMNENVQAYFGAPFLRKRTETPVATNTDDEAVDLRRPPTATNPVVISLTTPFIYLPARGRRGATVETGECTQEPGTEDYGYVPQTVLDFLVDNDHYSSQFVGLSSCIPAGPSIVPLLCPQLGGSLITFTTTFLSTPPISTSTRTFSTVVSTSTETSSFPATTVFSLFTSFEESLFTLTISASQTEIVTTEETSIPFTSSNFNFTFVSHTLTSTVVTQTQTFEESIAISTSTISHVSNDTEIIPGKEFFIYHPVFDDLTEEVPFQAEPVEVKALAVKTAPPVGVETGPSYKTNDIRDLTGVVETNYATKPDIGGGIATDKVNGDDRGQQAKTDPAGPAQTGSRPAESSQDDDEAIAQAICGIAGLNCPQKNADVEKGDSPKGVNIIIPNPTTIPAKAAPSGLPGQKTEIDGTNFIVVPSPTTFVASSAHPPDNIPGARVTIISGSPFIVIPSATNVPVVNAPSPLSKGSMTIINNTPFFAIPGSTSFPAPSGQATFSGVTSMIKGTPFIMIPGSTNIPVASAPPGVTGSLTIINNTPFVVVPGATNIPVAAMGGSASFGSTTINGEPMLVIPEPTKIPLANAPSGLVGTTSMIDGVVFLIVPSATNIPVPTSGPGSPRIGTTTLINGTPFLVISGATQIPIANAPATLRQGASTTLINGTPFLVIPSATTVQLPTPPANVPGAITSFIDGNPVLIFPSATRVPLSLASGISGGRTTTIDGTPFLVISGPTTVADTRGQITAVPGAITSLIDGTPVLIFPSATRVPLSLASGISGGRTTTIDGTPFLIISGPTTIADLRGQTTAFPGSLTVIDGTTELIINGPTTIPVDGRFSISGSTIVEDGTTKVIVSKPTTVPVKTTTRSTDSSSLVTSTSETSSKTKTSSSTKSTSSKTSSTSSSSTESSSTSSSTTRSSSAPTSTGIPQGVSSSKGLSTGAKVGIAFAVIFGVLLIAALIMWCLRRRRQRYMPVQQSQAGA